MKIKGFLTFAGGVAVGIGSAFFGAGKIYRKPLEKKSELSDKHLALFLMMNQWVKVKQNGKCLSDYLKKHGYKKIAIYGMSYAGETLFNELKNTEIEISYGIDKNEKGICSDIDIVSIDKVEENVDAIIVTAITYFNEIENTLSEKVSCPILSLEDILYEI